MGVDIDVWRKKIAAFPNQGPTRRRRRSEGVKLTNEGKWWRKQIRIGFAVLAAGLALFYTAPLCSYIVSQPSDVTPRPWFNQSFTENHQKGTLTNDDLNVPTHLLLLGGDIEVNPGPVNEDKKISWDDDNILGMSSGTPTSSMWIFKQEQEKQALLKQSQEEAEQSQKKAEEEEAKDKLKKEEDERKAKKREEDKAAWLQHLEDEENRQALEAEEKRNEAEKARVQAEEEEKNKKKNEAETISTPTESINEPSPSTTQKSSLKPLQKERLTPSSQNPSIPEEPMDPEVSK